MHWLLYVKQTAESFCFLRHREMAQRTEHVTPQALADI